ncbi:MAG: hypothetical protein RL220_874 [Bacteroidota bacterium]|jgi:hypothetical protein
MLIIVTFILLTIYNAFYLPVKFMPDLMPSFMINGYEIIKDNWALLTFLDFVAVATLFVDLITRYEKFTKSGQLIRLMLTALFFCTFALKFFMGMMELYIDGDVV